MTAALRFVPILLLLAAWQIASSAGLVSPRVLPGVDAVGSAFWSMLRGGELISNLARSLGRTFFGLGLAILFGIPAGVLMASSRPIRLVLNPIVQLFYPIPKSALIPVVLVWFGLNDTSKIVLIFIGCLLPLVISSYNGARGVNPNLLWSAASLGASRRAIQLEVVLPAAMPEILSGMRTALAFSFLLMVSSELVIASDGVGYLIATLGDGGAYAPMFAVILTVAIVGFIADQLFAVLSGYLLRWRDA